jgi:hypothetical protein
MIAIGPMDDPAVSNRLQFDPGTCWITPPRSFIAYFHYGQASLVNLPFVNGVACELSGSR